MGYTKKGRKSSYTSPNAKRNKKKRKSTELHRQRREARPSSHERTDPSVTAAQIELQAQRETTERETELDARVLPSSSVTRATSTTIMGALTNNMESENENSDDDETTDLDPDYDPFCEYAVASSDENKRIAIAYFFEKILKCPPEEEWGGRNGTITKICGFFNNNTDSFRKTVKKVFSAVLKCQIENIDYK